MTREEAYRLAMRACEETWNEKTCKQIEQALKQEPCEESISREDALMALTGEWTESTDELIHRFIRRIKKLPPVTPKQRTGRWIYDDFLTVDKCSCCGAIKGNYFFDDVNAPINFCPNCGTKMESEEQA